jgi:GTP-binding protein Era
MSGGGKKAAFAAVVGRPSVGKSTLVNRICGEKVSIVSPVPQTTRNAVRGILNRGEGQLVFVDTPGRHASERKLNRRLIEVSERAIGEADIALYVMDASRSPGSEERAVAGRLGALAARTVAVVNKMDAPNADYGQYQAFLRQTLPDIDESHCFPLSALKNEGIEPLLARLFAMAPEGPLLYPDDCYTDQELRFRIAELIREKAVKRLREELPHALYVEVADAELMEPEAGGVQKLWVRAFIMMERESQKGMVVGKGGAVIKAIRLAAEKDLNRIFDWKVELDLRVKSAPSWRRDDRLLKRLIT